MTDESKPKDREDAPLTPEEQEKYKALLVRCQEVDEIATVLTAAMLFYTQDHPHTQISDATAGAATFVLNHCKAVLQYLKADATPFARMQAEMLRMLQVVAEDIAAMQPTGQEGVTH